MISKIIHKNYAVIVEAIRNHFNKHMLSEYSYELRMYIDNNNTIRFESGFGSNTNDIFKDGYYMLCKAGGFIYSPWDYLGDVRYLLDYEDLVNIIEDIPSRPVTKGLVEKYIEDNHPEWIHEWIDKYHDNHYADEVENAQSILEEFLNSVNDFMNEKAEEATE